MKNFLAKTSAVCGLGLIGSSAFAVGETVSLPVAMDVEGYLSAGIIALGAVVAVAVGGYAAFWVIKKGLAWFSKAG